MNAENVTNPSLGAGPKQTANLKFSNWSRTVKWLLALVVIALIVIFGIKYHQVEHRNSLLSNPQTASALQVQDTVQAVSKLIQLPANETPTLATVTDASKIQNQAFFANAHNGDKVLIYTQAKVAILYRPSTNKIIQIGPVNIGSNNSTTTTGTTSSSNK